MVDEARVQRIAEAVETEAQYLADQGDIAASNALYELVYKATGDTLTRFADIVIQAEAEAGLIQ